MDLARIRKAIVAGLALLAILVPQLAGLEGDLIGVFDVVVAVLGAFGVYRIPNAERRARAVPENPELL